MRNVLSVGRDYAVNKDSAVRGDNMDYAAAIAIVGFAVASAAAARLVGTAYRPISLRRRNLVVVRLVAPLSRAAVAAAHVLRSVARHWPL